MTARLSETAFVEPSPPPPAERPPLRLITSESAQLAAPPATRDSRHGKPAVGAPALLIGLGVYFLAANLLAQRGVEVGGLLFLALGLSFLMVRIASGRAGWAVPSGLLLGFGTYVVLDQFGLVDPTGGWFFIFLGLGFVASYVIGAQFSEVWPLFPAAALIGPGIILTAAASAVLVPYTWMAAYWPVILIGIGAWHLTKGFLPVRARGPLGLALALVAVGYGIFALSAMIANTQVGTALR